MEFSSFGKELEIRLTARDAVRLGIDFQSFDYRDAAQRALLFELCDAAEAETGAKLARDRLVVHLYAREDGEMSFLLRESAREETGEFYVYVFADFDALLMAREYALGVRGMLYEKDGAFFLVSTRVADTLSDFCEGAYRTAHLFSFLEGARRVRDTWFFT